MSKSKDVSKQKKDSKRQAFINDFCIRLDALKHRPEDLDEKTNVYPCKTFCITVGFEGVKIIKVCFRDGA